MSYILDALKRAETERERGTVPGLHASPATVSAHDGTGRRAVRLWLVAAAFSLTLTGIGAGLWIGRTPEPASPVAVVAAPQNPTPTATLGSLEATAPHNFGASAVGATPAVSVTTPATEITPRAAVSTAAPNAQATGPAKQTAPKPRPTATPVAKVPAPTPTAKASAASAAASTETDSASLPWLNDLPAGVRSQLPALTVNGAVYSENPAQRLLLVNNQVVKQGGLVAPDLALEEIRTSSSVLSFRGTRFRLAH